MITYAQSIILGLLQGIAELFPISSLGHTVLLPVLLHWNLDQSSDQFVAFVILTHLATALVLLAFFWSDWMKIVIGMLRSLKERRIRSDDTYAKLGWLIVVSTVPAGILGILFEQRLKELFAIASVVSIALILNGVVLYIAELLRKKAPEGIHDDTAIAALTWKQAVVVGIFQCGALIPGFSRTGLTMTGGLMNGLSHENAARYSFLLATPIIFAAAVLKVPELFTGSGDSILGQAVVGALCAALSAYFSIRFLTKYFETKTLTPFAIYCVLVGVVSLFLI
ncbi:MAG: undecaprenyl-diphosphate phosphatase [Candidatus Paceibacterota bacterium]